eukprot:8682958-Alexandrium_andersonii.AAC.1
MHELTLQSPRLLATKALRMRGKSTELCGTKTTSGSLAHFPDDGYVFGGRGDSVHARRAVAKDHDDVAHVLVAIHDADDSHPGDETEEHGGLSRG